MLRGMSLLWRGFKLLLSASLLAVAAILCWLLISRQFDAGVLAIASVLLFFAAWPWVEHKRPNRAMALVGMVFAIAIAFIATNVYVGETPFPRPCRGRGVLLCEMQNLLFWLGGPKLAAAPFAALAAIVLGISVWALVRFRRFARD